MQLTRQVNRLLHDEHVHVQRLLDRLGALLTQDHAEALRAPSSEVAAFLRDLAGVLEHGLQRHFRFEEENLFPRLEDEGEGDMAALLREEHEGLLPLAAELLGRIRQALAGTLIATEWADCRRLALEFAERQSDHIEKEERALLPALEEALDEEQDLEISAAYQNA